MFNILPVLEQRGHLNIVGTGNLSEHLLGKKKCGKKISERAYWREEMLDYRHYLLFLTIFISKTSSFRIGKDRNCVVKD